MWKHGNRHDPKSSQKHPRNARNHATLGYVVDLPLFAAVVPWSKTASEKVGWLLGSWLHFTIFESMVAGYIYFTPTKKLDDMSGYQNKTYHHKKWKDTHTHTYWSVARMLFPLHYILLAIISRRFRRRFGGCWESLKCVFPACLQQIHPQQINAVNVATTTLNKSLRKSCQIPSTNQ